MLLGSCSGSRCTTLNAWAAKPCDSISPNTPSPRPSPTRERERKVSLRFLDTYQTWRVWRARMHRLLVLEPRFHHIPDRSTACVVCYGCPGGDLVGLARLERFAVQAQVVDAPAHGGERTATIGQTGDAHHVAALPIVRVGMKQVIADIFEDALDRGARHRTDCGMRIGDGREIQQRLTRDRVARQQGGAPAKTRREGDLGVLRLQQSLEN